MIYSRAWHEGGYNYTCRRCRLCEPWNIEIYIRTSPKKVWKETWFVGLYSFFLQNWCVDRTTRKARSDTEWIKNGLKIYGNSSSLSVWSLTRQKIIGSANRSPTTSRTQVDKKMLRNLISFSSIPKDQKKWTNGSFTASARHMPAAPADWRDLSGNNKLKWLSNMHNSTHKNRCSMQALRGHLTWRPWSSMR